MATKRSVNDGSVPVGTEPIPPGATKRASDHDLRPGEPTTPLQPGSEDAAGTPGGGTEVGGLAGTNVGDGAPENAELEAAMGSNVDPYDEEQNGPPYSGHSGGAVGGTPAEGRSSGGTIRGGLAPGAGTRGDTTIGGDPEKPRSK